MKATITVKLDPVIKEIKAALVKLVGNNLLIAQNTTNAAMHNQILGASVKEFFEDVRKGICWVYDSKSITDSDYGRFFPSDSEKLRYVFISNTRKNQIKTALRKAGISNRVNWQKSTIIYPPVINEKIINQRILENLLIHFCLLFLTYSCVTISLHLNYF